MPETAPAEIVDSYENVKIMRTEETPLLMYIVMPPKFTPEEEAIIKTPKALVSDYKEVMKKLESFRTSIEKEEFLRKYLEVKLEEKGISSRNLENLVEVIMDDVFLGYGKIGCLIRDDNLEEIMINGVGIPIFVLHRKHGMCMTNIEYESYQEINELIEFLSRYSGREINEHKPLLDGHMPDGSRANVAIDPAAPHGPAITIRKFKRSPYNIIDLIALKTINVDLAAFLWTCIEGFGLHPCNILIAGGSGSGKTTLFNALSMFIPPSERIITIEDTLELNLEFLDNWVALEANPSVIERAKLDMEALVENSLRMRPDRVLVGEVRGREAYTLFVAMDIGLYGSMCTIHSNTARESTIRLIDEPMNVPIRMIPLIDLVVVLNRYFERKRGVIRRVTEVAEISGIEGEVVQLGEIYRWNSKTDKIERTSYPILLKEKISEWCGMSKKALDRELYVREKVLEWMVKNNIRDNEKVIEIFQQYHKNPKAVIERIRSKKIKGS
jgi:flagellar protein FlaI